MQKVLLLFGVSLCGTLSLPMQRAPTDLEGIAHIAFRVTDIQATRRFYEELGYEQAFAFSKDGRISESFIKINDTQYIELYPQSDSAKPLGITHLCYQSKDLSSLVAAYDEIGLNASPVKKAGAGNLLSILHDPDGQIIEYTQYLADSMHSQDSGKHMGEKRIAGAFGGAILTVGTPSVEFEFFTRRLHFHEVNGLPCARLMLPGNSRQEVEFACESNGSKPGLIFAVRDLEQAVKDLRERGLTFQRTGGMIYMRDPDGNVIEFRNGLYVESKQ